MEAFLPFLFLVPITFIFAIAALTKVTALEKEMNKLKAEFKKDYGKNKKEL